MGICLVFIASCSEESTNPSLESKSTLSMEDEYPPWITPPFTERAPIDVPGVGSFKIAEGRASYEFVVALMTENMTMSNSVASVAKGNANVAKIVGPPGEILDPDFPDFSRRTFTMELLTYAEYQYLYEDGYISGDLELEIQDPSRKGLLSETILLIKPDYDYFFGHVNGGYHYDMLHGADKVFEDLILDQDVRDVLADFVYYGYLEPNQEFRNLFTRLNYVFGGHVYLEDYYPPYGAYPFVLCYYEGL